MNCLLLCNGCCALFCGCRPSCEEVFLLQAPTASLHGWALNQSFCVVGHSWCTCVFCGTSRLTRTTPWINAWYLLYSRCVDEVNWSWFQASKHPGPLAQQKHHVCPCPGGVPKELVAHWPLRHVCGRAFFFFYLALVRLFLLLAICASSLLG